LKGLVLNVTRREWEGRKKHQGHKKIVGSKEKKISHQENAKWEKVNKLQQQDLGVMSLNSSQKPIYQCMYPISKLKTQAKAKLP